MEDLTDDLTGWDPPDSDSDEETEAVAGAEDRASSREDSVYLNLMNEPWAIPLADICARTFVENNLRTLPDKIQGRN